MTLGKRIREAREAAGLGKSELAKQVGVSPSAVTQWESDDTKTMEARNLLKAARAMGVDPDWLATGKGSREADDLARGARGLRVEEPSNVYAGPEIHGRVPLISWVQAGSFSAVVDNLHPGQAEEWVETTVPVRRHTYALRIRGDSMTNPGGDPTFPDGSIIVVEPDAIDTPDKLVGSFVIVKRASDDEATFKQLVKDAGRFYLKPLNPRYPMLELGEDDVFCGVVRERVVRFF
jgi:SOS-response transcriptional repressor LexA